MRVPHRVVDGRIAWLATPVDVHHSHAGLDQPPCQQQRLTPLRACVAVANLLRLLLNGERPLYAPRSQKVEGLALKRVVQADGAIDRLSFEVPLNLFE